MKIDSLHNMDYHRRSEGNGSYKSRKSAHHESYTYMRKNHFSKMKRDIGMANYENKRLHTLSFLCGETKIRMYGPIMARERSICEVMRLC